MVSFYLLRLNSNKNNGVGELEKKKFAGTQLEKK